MAAVAEIFDSRRKTETVKYIEFIRSHGSAGASAAELLAPALALLADVIYGVDERGQPFSGYFGAEVEFEDMKDQLVWSHFMAPVKATIRPWEAMIELYDKHPAQVPMKLQYEVGRAFGGGDNLLSGPFGYEPRSIAGQFDLETGGVPGGLQYPVRLDTEVNRAKRKALTRASSLLRKRIRLINKKEGF